MKKAICSRVDLDSAKDPIATEFSECLHEIIELKEVVELKKFYQHIDVDRFQHSLNVAYYTFLIAKTLGLNVKEATRAALLHDLYFYEYGKINLNCFQHSRLHAELALMNARSITELTDMEQDIIVNHMWPMTFRMPRYAESFVVTFVDKGCATVELFLAVSRFIKTAAKQTISLRKRPLKADI